MDETEIPYWLQECTVVENCEGFGDNHYHCGRCMHPKPTSMLGHFINGEFQCPPSETISSSVSN